MRHVVERLLDLARLERVAVGGEEVAERGPADGVHEEADAPGAGGRCEHVRAGEHTVGVTNVADVYDHPSARRRHFSLERERRVGVVAAVRAEEMQTGIAYDGPRDRRSGPGGRTEDHRPALAIRRRHADLLRRSLATPRARSRSAWTAATTRRCTRSRLARSSARRWPSARGSIGSPTSWRMRTGNGGENGNRPSGPTPIHGTQAA